MAPLGKELAVSLTLTESGSVVTATIVAVNKDDSLLLKRCTLKIAVLTAFYGDRSKFKIYVLQVRLYWWADAIKPTKLINIRELLMVRDQIVWAASYLRGEAEARFRSYLEDKLINGPRNSVETKEIFDSTVNYFAFLFISYKDLNETRTVELKLNRLR
jgi:hypothetical protein